MELLTLAVIRPNIVKVYRVAVIRFIVVMLSLFQEKAVVAAHRAVAKWRSEKGLV